MRQLEFHPQYATAPMQQALTNDSMRLAQLQLSARKVLSNHMPTNAPILQGNPPRETTTTQVSQMRETVRSENINLVLLIEILIVNCN